jgi:DNA-binding CsgD family transcriptional regulator
MQSELGRYRVPLPVLGGFLGPSKSRTEHEPSHKDGALRRTWHCGCVARYRNSAHQTASWQPCPAHRSDSLQPQPVEVQPRGETTLRPDVLGRRLGPTFCIIDVALNVLCKSPGTEVESLLAQAREHVERAVSNGEPLIVRSGESTLLRIMPLRGAQSGTFAIVIEQLRTRGSLSAAVTRFGLTPREGDVLRLIVANHRTRDIAERLHIAESTVSDHVKSLYRKIGCKRRTELLTKLFLI